MKISYITQAWLVLVLAFCFGASLAGVQTALSSRIEANKMAETNDQIPMLVPGASGSERELFGDMAAYRAMNDAGQTIGWVIPAKGQGFADVIEVLIGVNADASEITGVYVLDQKETPGLGNKIVEADWRDQFKGKNCTEPLEVVKMAPQQARQIEAVTGATISSDSVVGIINRTAKAFRQALKERG